ncbi:MAG: hypothetical protein K0B37_05535 [Bacteroidales bacterium]|nr:hypothetical protein [Bacteroidales bacterium]
MEQENHLRFYDKLVRKAGLKKHIYQNTLEVFQELKLVADLIRFETDRKLTDEGHSKIRVEFQDKGDFEAELRFAADTLVFLMHSNVFEFPRAHDVMKTPYIKVDPNRSFSGVINIYNFLSDSFRYNRINDLGYLVARVFINKDKHFLVEGKHQTGFYYNQFMGEAINQDDLRRIIESAVLYSIDFDLLLTPYDLVKEISVSEIHENSAEMRTRTGKRLGFRFQADHDKTPG